MDRLGRKVVSLLTAAAIGISGCGLSKQRKMTYEEHDDTSIYDSTSLAIEEPAFERDDPFGLNGSAPPVTISDDEPTAYKDVSLEEVIQTALKTSRVLRDLGGTVLR